MEVQATNSDLPKVQMKLSSLQEAAAKLRMANDRKRKISGPAANIKSMIERCIELVISAAPNDSVEKIDTLSFWANLSTVFYLLNK